MYAALPKKRLVRFGPYELDFQTSELRKQGVKIKLSNQPCSILQVLLSPPGELVTREQLRQLLWGENVFVDYDHGLNNAVTRLREALFDNADVPRFIETVPRLGYRFIAPVEEVSVAAVDGTPAEPIATIPARTIGQGFAPPSLPNGRKQVLAISLAAIGFISLIALLFWWFGGYRSGKRSPGDPGIHSIAVLPFEDFSATPKDYFADEMTDSVITALAESGPLRVTSKTTVLQFKKNRPPMDRIASTLGVNAILEGSVSRDANTVRVVARLIDGKTDKYLWAQSYERPITEIFRLENEIARSIAVATRQKMGDEQGEFTIKAHSVDPKAYELFVRGRHALQERFNYSSALQDFEAAIAIDQNFPEAYAGMSETYALAGLGMGNLPPREAAQRANEAAQKALELDPNSGEAHAAIGLVKFHYDWDWGGAEAEFREALRLSPACANGILWYSHLLAITGRPLESDALTPRIRNSLPSSLFWEVRVSSTMYEGAGQPEKAVARFREALLTQPTNPRMRLDLAALYRSLGKPEEALAQERIVDAEYPNNRLIMAFMGMDYARLKNFNAAENMIEKLKREEERVPGWPAYAIARIELIIGQDDEAIRWLQRAYDDRTPQLIDLGRDFARTPLWKKEGFRDIYRKIGLPESLLARES